MSLGELQNKDVVSIEDGKLIGSIVDVNIDDSGKITSLVIAKKRFLFSWFFSKHEVEITWSQINKIGKDVILIKVFTNSRELFNV